MHIKENDIVGRISYNCDILFRVIKIKNNTDKKTAILFGEDIRLIADAPYDDLIIVDNIKQQELQRQSETKATKSYELFKRDLYLSREERQEDLTNNYGEELSYFQMPGRVLHLDGDGQYLKKCMEHYEKLGVPAYGVHCNEKEMPNYIAPLLKYYRPDILVITGHDAYSKSKGEIADLNAYRHSLYFVQTVQEARQFIPHLDQLVIFAGACQSHFESLIQAGANFASSPSRVNIHALDPVYIVAKICFTPYKETINVLDALKNTLSGEKGLGGLETNGVLRIGMPYKAPVVIE